MPIPREDYINEIAAAALEDKPIGTDLSENDLGLNVGVQPVPGPTQFPPGQPPPPSNMDQMAALAGGKKAAPTGLEAEYASLLGADQKAQPNALEAEYSGILAEEGRQADLDRKQEEELLRFLTINNGKVPAAKLAEAAQYAAVLPGMDPEFIVQNLDDIRSLARAQQIDWAAVREQHPVLSRFIRKDPAAAGLMMDETATLTDRLQFWMLGKWETRTVEKGEKNAYGQEYAPGTRVTEQVTPPVLTAMIRDSFAKNVPAMWNRAAQKAAQFYQAVMPHGALDEDVAKEIDRRGEAADVFESQGTGAKDYLGTRFDGEGIANKAGRFTALGMKFAAEAAPMVLAAEAGGMAGVVGSGAKTIEAIAKARYAGVALANTIYVAPGMLHRIENLEVNGEKVGFGKAAALTAVGAPIVGHIMGTGLSDVFGTQAYNLLGVGAANTVERALASESGLALATAYAKRFGIDFVVGKASFAAQSMVDASLDEIARGMSGGDMDIRKIGHAAGEGWRQGNYGVFMYGYGAARRLYEDAGRMVRAQETEKRLKVMMDPAAAERIQKENPALYEKIVAETSKEPGAATHLYLDLLTLQEYAQSLKLDPKALITEVMQDGGKLYDDAIANNELDIAIPVDKAARMARSKGLSEFVVAEGRFDPADYSPGMMRRAAEAFTSAVEESLALDPAKMKPDELAIYEDFRKRSEEAVTGTKVEDPKANAAETSKVILALVKGFQTRMPDRTLDQVYQETYGRVGVFGTAIDTFSGSYKVRTGDKQGQPVSSVLNLEPASKVAIKLGENAAKSKGQTLYLRSKNSPPGEFGEINIFMLPEATVNTLPHESAHALSWILKDYYYHPDTPAAIKNEYAALVKAMGYASPEDRDTNRQVINEEKLARWFETYLMEGKAPSPELVPTFMRFGDWLGKMYEQYTIEQRWAAQFPEGPKLGPLHPDLRAMLNRLLVSRDAIDKAVSESRVTRPNEKVREMLKTPEEKAKYDEIVTSVKSSAQERLLAAIRAGERSFVREERERIIERVREEMRKDPVYRALHFLKTGELWPVTREGGDPTTAQMLTNPDTGKPFRFLSTEIKQRYGKDVLEVLRKKKGLVTDKPEESADLDMYANALRFKGADGLVAGIRDALPEGEFVKKKAEALVQGMYRNDLIENPQELAQRAMDAAHNEKVAQKIVVELRALSGSLDPRRAARSKMTKEMWESLAQRLIASKVLANIKPEQYVSAMGRASEKARKAIEEGSMVRAFDATEAQLLNYYLYKAARKTDNELGSAYEKLAEKATSDSWRMKLGKADPAYRRLHDALLSATGIEDLGLGNIGAKAVDDFLTQVQANNQGKNLAPWDVDLIKAMLGGTKAWKDLTPAEAKTVYQAITNIQHIAKTQHEAVMAGKKIETRELAEEAIRYMAGMGGGGDGGQPPEGPIPPGPFEPMRDTSQPVPLGKRIHEAAATHMANRDEPRVWLGFMGPELKSRIWGEFLVSRTRRERILKDVFQSYKEVWAKYENITDRFEPVPGIAEALPMEYASGPATKAWLMTAMKWFGSESGRKKLLEGTGWTADQVLQAAGKFLSPADMEHVMREHKISDEKLWPLEAEVYERRYGVPLEKTVAMPYEIIFADGTVKTYEGGYWPVKYDKRLAHLRGRMAQEKLEQGATTFYPATPNSALHERTSYVDVPDLNWGDYPAHIAAVIHDYAFGDFVKDAGRVLLDRDLNIAMQRYLGQAYADQPLAWLERVATDASGSTPAHLRELTKLQQWSRSALMYAGLGWNVATISADLLHPFMAGLMRDGSGFAVTKVAPSFARTLGAATASLVSGKNDFYEQAKGKFSSLQHREDMVISEMRRWYGELQTPKRGRWTRTEEAIRNTAFWHMGEMDKIVSTIIADAKYRDVLAKTGDEAKAIEAANEAVDGSMPTHSIMEMSSFMTDKRGVGAMVIFFSYYDKLYQMAHEAGHAEVYLPFRAAQTGGGTLGQAGASAAMWAGRTMAMLTISAVMGDFLMGHGKAADEEWDEWFLRKTLAAPAQPLPFGSSLAQPIADILVTGKIKRTNFLRAPGYAMLYQALDLTGKLASSRSPNDEKIAKVVETLLMMRQLPSRAPVRAAQYLTNVAQGDAKPRGPFDFASGVMFGEKARNREATPGTVLQDLFSK